MRGDAALLDVDPIEPAVNLLVPAYVFAARRPLKPFRARALPAELLGDYCNRLAFRTQPPAIA